MSISLFKQFDIDEDGKCGACSQLSEVYNCSDWEDCPTYSCAAFNCELEYNASECGQCWEVLQCQECKDFILTQKAICLNPTKKHSELYEAFINHHVNRRKQEAE